MTGENHYEAVDNSDGHLSLVINMSEAFESVNATLASLTGGVPPTDDPEYIDYLKYQLAIIRLVVQKVLSPIVISFGVMGNLLNIAVLTRRWMRSSTNYYLTALAVCDIFYLLFALTMTLKHYPSIYSTYAYFRYYFTLGRPLVDIWSNVSVWLTLTFTVERYIGVCHPMKGKRWCTPERARYIIVAVTFAAAIITFPEFFDAKVESVVNKDDNGTRYRPGYTAFGQTTSYQLGYIYLNQALFTFLPLLLLAVFNTLLIRAVQHAAKRRKTMSAAKNDKHARQQRDQQKITIMLISVVIVFLICQLPQAVQKGYQTYLDITGGRTIAISLKLKSMANFFNLLVMLNCSVNFVLYSSFSTKFRLTFRKMFCTCLDKRRRTPEIMFSEVGTANPSPTEDSRCRLLIRPHNNYKDQSSTVPLRHSPTGDAGGYKATCQGPTALKSRNGYLDVKQSTGV